MVNSLFPLIVTDATVKKRGKTIVGPVNVRLEQKGLTIVLGPNGSGKTTFLRLLHGLEKPKKGSVSWSVPHDEAVQSQAFVFQAPVMMRRSVLENLRYPLSLRNISNAESLVLARKACADINLEKSAEMPANFLSGGEKQKLALARALITQPEVLFLDEPTSNLGGQATREIETMLLKAKQNGTRIFMATHDLGQAKRLADDVLFLYRGGLHEHKDAKLFFGKPQTIEAQAYLSGDILE